MAAKGIRVSSVRHPPSVHGDGDHGFLAILLAQIARNSGLSGYIGDGSNRWPAVHLLDAAPLYLKALMQRTGRSGPELGRRRRDPCNAEIAEAIGRALDIRTQSVEPSRATAHFGFLAMFFALDLPASSELTRASYDWHPTHAGLLDDLNAGHYTREPSTAATTN